MVQKRNKTNLRTNTYKKKISIFFACLVLLIGIIITTGILLFSNKEDLSKPQMLAYIYDGKQHDAPPSKENYEIDVVNCDKAIGVWSNTNWNLTLKDIEGTTKCIASFKKKLSIYNLKIDPNGGTYKESTGIQSVDVKETSTYQLDVPTRRGYDFVGWDVEGEESSISGSIFKMGIENSKVTAQWNKKSYQVEIRNSNTCDEIKDAEFESTVELCEPTKDGYTFAGWETTSGTLDGNSLIVSDSNAIVTANWTINNYDYIVYHKQQGLNGGYTIKETETNTATFNTSVSPNTKTYTGFATPPKQTITITSGTNEVNYEYTRNRYHLTINPNGGTTSTELSQEVFFEKEVNIQSPVKEGYTFTNWSGATLQDTILTMPANNVTLSANYTANSYTVYFDANQGTVNPTSKTVIYDSTYGELPTPSRDGYTFNGWYVNGIQIESTSIVKITQSTSAVAHWLKDSYMLTINPNGGSYNNSTSAFEQGLEFEQELNIVDPNWEGHTFTGWTVSGNGSTYNANTKVFKMGFANATLTANWDTNTYKLTISDTFTCDIETYVTYQGTYSLCTPEREGYTFTGWDDPDDIINNNAVIMRAKDSTLRAKWEVNNYDYIVYHNRMDVNGSSYTRVDGDTYQSEAEFGTVIYTLAKDYTGFIKPNNIDITIGVDTSIPPEKNIANYDYERNKYTLTINPNGGTYNGSTNTTSEEMFYNEEKRISSPTKEGYNFDSWSKSGNSTFNQNTNMLTMGTENTTLTATYSAKTFQVRFDSNGGSEITSSIDVTYNSTYGNLPETVRTGYNFSGWYTAKTGGTKIETNTVVQITNTQTLYAHWTKKTFTVNFDPNGGSVSPTFKSVEYDSQYGTLPTPSKERNIFLGWYTSSTGGTKIESSTIVQITTDQTLYAHWRFEGDIPEIGGSKDFDYTGDIQTFTAAAGIYQLQVWGASGGVLSATYERGNGGYATGTIALGEGKILYIVVGQKGINNRAGTAYNGGGKGRYGGGGATHIATMTGLLADLSNNTDAVLIVAGAGGGASENAMKGGGAGGGLNGGDGLAATRQANGTLVKSNARGEGGSQTAGGKAVSCVGNNNYNGCKSSAGGFGYGGENEPRSISGGGGSGWYGGSGGSRDSNKGLDADGGGGSSYIGGVSNGQTIAGDTEFASPTGEVEKGHYGNGYARITRLS